MQDLETLETTTTTWRQQLAAATVEERYTMLKQYLRAKLQTVLGIAPTDEQNLFELGLDSLTAIRLITQLNSELQLNLSIIAFFELTTLVELTERLNILLTNQLTPMETNPADSQVERGEI